jgi:hypothetical protein
VRLENRARLIRERRILDPGLREALRDEPIQPRIGWLVDNGSFVLALEVDRFDAAELGQLGDELVRPAAPGVELEL